MLASERATDEIDYIAGAVEHNEYTNSTWYYEPLSFMKSERAFVRLHQGGKDAALKTTLRALENITAFMLGDFLNSKIGNRLHWEADFTRFCLGFVTALEERQFNEMSQGNRRLLLSSSPLSSSHWLRLESVYLLQFFFVFLLILLECSWLLLLLH